VHASWLSHNGFRGRPVELIEALKAVVGPGGLLSMTSMPYHNESSAQFLERGGVMDVRRSASRMGLLTEVFRRNRETRRSLSPTHPILAWGERADWFVADHQNCLSPFGPGSPFAKLLQLDGKILTLDAPFSTITFTHFLEDRIASSLPFSLYEPQPRTATVVDDQDRHLEVPVRVISREANARRREERLVAALEREGLLHRSRVGNTRLLLVECRAMTDCVDRMVAAGQSFFD
ncbi:MAG: AAC(3) family N-acetyltransferase, partial [Candidatus Competibacteraceae bacterium]|nr:AAC(3) family N-acetyltransferase [Candidatus Competibacteraceae bacterium]